jgi:hypothetical protein
MRINQLIFVGSLAALVATMAPALAKNSQTQKPDQQAISSSCHAYQQAPDGTWVALPCQAHGTGASAQTERKQQMTGNSDNPRR